VRDLTPDPDNANRGTQRGRAMVETSVRRYGFGRSVLIDKHGRLIAGNKTVEAAAAIGDPNVIVVPTTGKSLVVVQRTDLDLRTDVDAKALAVADNRTTEVGLAWNVPALQRLEEAAKQFWRAPEWEKLVADGGAAGDPTADGIPEMALQPFEEYNYLMVVFKNSQDWQGACDRLGVKREAVTLGTTRKIGLGRVLDGAVLLESLCKSSSPAVPASSASKRTRSRSSPTPRSASARPKPPPTDASPPDSSSTPTT
jgi:hypothetical protein